MSLYTVITGVLHAMIPNTSMQKNYALFMWKCHTLFIYYILYLLRLFRVCPNGILFMICFLLYYHSLRFEHFMKIKIKNFIGLVSLLSMMSIQIVCLTQFCSISTNFSFKSWEFCCCCCFIFTCILSTCHHFLAFGIKMFFSCILLFYLFCDPKLLLWNDE